MFSDLLKCFSFVLIVSVSNLFSYSAEVNNIQILFDDKYSQEEELQSAAIQWFSRIKNLNVKRIEYYHGLIQISPSIDVTSAVCTIDRMQEIEFSDDKDLKDLLMQFYENEKKYLSIVLCIYNADSNTFSYESLINHFITFFDYYKNMTTIKRLIGEYLKNKNLTKSSLQKTDAYLMLFRI